MNIINFPLYWRWTEVDQYPLSKSILKKMHPFDNEKAKEIQNKFLNHFVSNELNPELYCSIISHPANHSCSFFLESLKINTKSKISIIWNEETALSTSWEIFKYNWEAFCYPGSDDVLIIPETKNWLIVYYHYELFTFGKKN